MSYSRPSARTLTGVLLGLILFSIVSAPVVLGKDVPVVQQPMGANPSVACGTTVTAPDGTKTFTNNLRPTNWPDDVHPPTSVRVLRSQGPNKGHVETVPFYWYVAVVMRAEYSTGANKPPLWMQVGAITVKEYGWYKAMHWGGGHVTFTSSVTDPTDPTLITTTTTSECYDLKDTTADQLYRPPTMDANNVCIPNTGNCPTSAIYKAMAQTWQMSMRKWNTTKNVSRLFLTGYRSGNKNPCGADRTGFKIYQQSLRDCSTKGLTLEETLRAYFEPVLLVNTRPTDVMNDGAGWWGDAPSLSNSGGNTGWAFYPGQANGFGQPVTGTFNVPFSSIVGYGVGNIDLPHENAQAGDPNMLADVVMVTNGTVYAARSTGVTNQTDPRFAMVTTTFTGGAADAVFGDFNGDLLMDVGLVRSNGDGSSSLWVMYAKGDGTFNAPVQRWASVAPDGPDITAPGFWVSAGDVNGDGKADLIVRDGSGNFNVAASPATCGSMATYGTCLAPGGPMLGTLNLALADPGGLNNAKLTVGDVDRDGRDDIVGFNGGASSNALALRAKADGSGTFNGIQSLWHSSANDLTGASAVAMNVDPDGMADLAVINSNGSALWLRTLERSSSPAQMVLSSQFPYSGQDKTAPSTPTNLKATASSGLTISLVWNPSVDNTGGAVFYRVFRDGRKIGTQQAGVSYTDHPRAGWHAYTIKAVDAVGNLSSASNKVTVKAFN